MKWNEKKLSLLSVILTVEVNEVEEWEVEKILNKRKVREVMKYLVY